MKYETIFLDVDNTLLDFHQAEIYALSKVCEAVEYPYSESIRQRYRYFNDQLWQQIEAGKIDMETLKKTRFTALAKELGWKVDPLEMSHLYMTYLAEADFEVPGAYEMCQRLSKHYQLAVVTNGITFVQKSRFEKSRLREWMSGYFISEEIGISKPDPGIFQYAMDELQITDAKKVLMIGDSLTSDMKGGENAGIDTCFYNPHFVQTTGKVTYEVHDLLEVPTLLETLEKK